MIVFHALGATIMFCVHHPLAALLLFAAGLGGLAWLCRRSPAAPPAPPPVVVRTGGAGALAVASLAAVIAIFAPIHHAPAAAPAVAPTPAPTPTVTVTERVTHITRVTIPPGAMDLGKVWIIAAAAVTALGLLVWLSAHLNRRSDG